VPTNFVNSARQRKILLLALDTATDAASIALYDFAAEQLLAELTWQARRRQTRDLLVTVGELLRQVQATPQQITALAVTTGPGSFTGVRIALAAAKGLGLGLPTPPRAIGLPTLCVTAAPWLSLAAASRPPPRLCACLQAGRGRYNWAFFAANARLQRPLAAQHAAGTTSEFAQALAQCGPPTSDQPVWLVGEVADPLATAVAGLAHVTLVDTLNNWRRAGYLAKLAAIHLASGTHDDLKTLQPIYLRTP
jgi:tRNA threonylcarbamoyladenosine biosynthesis protein TsaB